MSIKRKIYHPLKKILIREKRLWSYILQNKIDFVILILLSLTSIIFYLYFSKYGLHVAYNDAMSHLNIARRVFDNLQPGLAQLGSVWLPLPHVLMLPTIWDDGMWHSGLSAGIISMVSYVMCCFMTYKTVVLITKNRSAGIFSALIVASNLNFLYMQTTALTEPLFMGLFSMSLFFLVKWSENLNPLHLVLLGACTFFMTLTRYDAWFVFPFFILAVFIISYVKRGLHAAEGFSILYSTSGALGIFLWFLYNYIIFKDPFYFALGEFSAKAQQTIMYEAGVLSTKGNIWLSLLTYYYAVIDNIGIVLLIFAALGFVLFMIKEKGITAKVIGISLLSTTIFNVLALYLGFSVIFVPELSGSSWFNVRYGLIVLPVAALFIGYLVCVRIKVFSFLVVVLVVIQTGMFFQTGYAVTITDGTKGSSQKNVRPIGRVMEQLYNNERGLTLVSAASHDAILFSSKIPLKEFIHEGAEKYWESALANPELYAEYVIMRTNDEMDSVSRSLSKIPDFKYKFTMVYDGDFADIYKRNP